MRRLVLYQCTHAAVSDSTSARRRNGPVRNGESSRTASALYRPMVVLATALSKASPTDSIDGTRPDKDKVSPNRTDVYWLFNFKGAVVTSLS